MANWHGIIRNSAQAPIVRDRAALLQGCEFDGRIVHLLPGGIQEFGESLGDAVRREVYEEAGLRVRVDGLLWVRECIARTHGAVEDDGHHVVESIFRCTPELDGVPGAGSLPDTEQIAIRWVPFSALPRLTMWPEMVRQALIADPAAGSALPPTYLGDCP